jgi:hypothetical protein
VSLDGSGAAVTVNSIAAELGEQSKKSSLCIIPPEAISTAYFINPSHQYISTQIPLALYSFIDLITNAFNYSGSRERKADCSFHDLLI